MIAAKRSKLAGFDLLRLYGTRGVGILQHLLPRATNQRSDEYGGGLENRARFVNEVIADICDVARDGIWLSLGVSLD